MSSAADRAELGEADLEVIGRFEGASNLTLLARTAGGMRCVYKPISGEQPLWDFPDGTLAGREVATDLLAAALGWDVVPATVLRQVGSHGPGVCQRFIEAAGEPAAALLPAAEPGWLVVAEGEGAHGERVLLAHRDTRELRQLALLDAVANNGDRKGGHILCDADGRCWGIDHGVSFHAEDKLRTVLWGFAGQSIDDGLLAPLARLRAAWEPLADRLAGLLSPVEIEAAAARLTALVAAGRFPQPQPGWPRLPWPPL